MIPTDMKTEEQPKTDSRSFTDTMLRAQAEAKYLAVNASENELIDEIIDLKRKLNAMVRLCKSIYINEGAGKASPDDLDLWDDLEKEGYGGDEVPE